MTLLKEQTEVSNQRGIPANEKNSSSTITTITGETIQLFYWNSSGVRTQDAGQVAGTVVEGVLAKNNVLNKAGTMEATSKDTSLSFTAGALTTEKPLLITDIEYLDSLSGKDRANAITANLANGEYVVDYAKGIIYGKKTTTATTLASATYKYPVINIALSSGDIQIGAVEIKDGSTDTRTKVGVASAIVNTDNAVAVADPTNLPCAIPAEYASPYDFTVAYTSNVTLTVTGSPFTVDDANCTIVGIMYKPTAGSWTRLYNGKNGVSITAAANVITVAGAGTPFASGDIYRVSINYQKKGYDITTDSVKTTVINPDSNKWVLDSLVDATNIAAGTNYYPSATGMPMDGYSDLFLSGKLIDADNTTTMTFEVTNDEDPETADWIQVYLWDDNGNAAVDSVAAASTTKTFALAGVDLGYAYFRIKLVTGDSTNTVIIKAKRKA